MSMSEELAPDRLEALLRGEAGVSGHERRIGALLDELTMGEIAPPAALRERVRGLAAAAVEAAPEPRGRRLPRLRRPGLRLAPVLGVAATLAVVAGVAVTQRADAPAISTPNPAAAERQQLGAVVPASGSGQGATQGLALTPPAASKVAAVPAPDGRRAQDYAASLRLAVGSVAELSRSTQTVLESVRSLGGAVESVDYGTPSAGSGSALIELRIPVSRAQEALRQFSALGTITSQQVQIRDLQASLDQGTNRARALRRRIALLQAKLLSPVLTPEARAMPRAGSPTRSRRLPACCAASTPPSSARRSRASRSRS